jgi:4-phosphopantoate--beta-alanine ligase
MAEAYQEGILADTALIAHGRGEAFDYILGEKTSPAALEAIRTGISAMLLADNPVISVNGNTAVLTAEYIVELSHLIPAPIEINLFYRLLNGLKKWRNY